MKVFGPITELVSALFRKDSQQITLRPSQTTTYTANRSVDLPPQDANAVIVSESASQTLTNKSIDADTNTITNIENADIKAGAAIDATKIADGSVSNTEFQLLNGLTTMVTPSSTDTFTNKSMDGDNNTFTDIGISSLKTVLADADKVIRRDASGAVISGNSLPNSSALVTTDSTSSLSNKTLASPIITTAATFNAEAELRLADSDSSNYVGFKSPATVSSNQIWTLPSADGSSGQALTTNGSGILQFATISGGGSAAYSAPSSNVTLTSASARKQIFAPSVPIDVTLPTTGIVAGDIFTITNLDALNAPITIKASGGAVVYYIDLCSGTVELVANQATPTLPAHWSLVTPVRSEVTTITPLSWNGAAWSFASDFCTAQRNANMLTIKTAGIVTSVGGGVIEASLPNVGVSLTIDTTFIQDTNNNIAIGTLYRLSSPGPEYIYDAILVGAGNVMIADPDNPQYVYASQNTQSYIFNKSVGSGLSSNNDYIEVEFTIPITQWKKQ